MVTVVRISDYSCLPDMTSRALAPDSKPTACSRDSKQGNKLICGHTYYIK